MSIILLNLRRLVLELRSRPIHLKQPGEEGLVEPTTTAGALGLSKGSLASQELVLLVVNDILASVKVNFMGLVAAGLQDELVAKDEGQVDGNTKVSRDEGLVLFVAKVATDKDVVVLGEGDKNAHEKGTI